MRPNTMSNIDSVLSVARDIAKYKFDTLSYTTKWRKQMTTSRWIIFKFVPCINDD